MGLIYVTPASWRCLNTILGPPTIAVFSMSYASLQGLYKRLGGWARLSGCRFFFRFRRLSSSPEPPGLALRQSCYSNAANLGKRRFASPFLWKFSCIIWTPRASEQSIPSALNARRGNLAAQGNSTFREYHATRMAAMTFGLSIRTLSPTPHSWSWAQDSWWCPRRGNGLSSWPSCCSLFCYLDLACSVGSNSAKCSLIRFKL